MLPEKRPDAPPPEGLIDTGPTPPLTGRAIEQPHELAEGPERRAYELLLAGKIAEAAKLGPAATPALLLASLRPSTSARQHIAILEALGRVGDERALPRLQVTL